MRWCRSRRRGRTSLAAGIGTAAVLCAGVTGAPAQAMSPARVVSLARPASPAGRRAEAASIAVSCRSPAHPRLAARLARGIHAALAGRVSTVALRVEDRSEDLGCFLNTTMRSSIRPAWSRWKSSAPCCARPRPSTVTSPRPRPGWPG